MPSRQIDITTEYSTVPRAAAVTIELTDLLARLTADDLLELVGRRLAIRPEDTVPSPWAEGSTVESDT
jgi:hypothetical protein